MRTSPLLAAVAFASLPFLVASAKDDDKKKPAVQDATVDFGVLPTAPLGPAPCLQAGPIGGPADPCAYKVHHLTPEEVTIRKGGEVSFQIHGGGHGIAIYKVDEDTTRDQIGQFLCAGVDPATVTNPALLNCNASQSNANAAHLVGDGDGETVLNVSANVSNVHPENRVWSQPGRLMSAGAHQFLNGGTIPAGPMSNGQLITYRFLKGGRYLVICINRSHFFNDWMFGFVNVGGDDDD